MTIILVILFIILYCCCPIKVYEKFSTKGITYVTKLKDNAKYEGLEELDIPDDSDPGIKESLILHINQGV